jgi:hypothetical protein
VLNLAGIILGFLLRSALPRHHLDKDSQDVVRLGVGLIATMAALVVGLLIASAKSSFDTESGRVKQMKGDIILLDNFLAQYGPDAAPLGEEMRAAVPTLVDRIWQEKTTSTAQRFEPNSGAEKLYLAIQALTPKNDLQRSLQSRAVRAATDFAQTRLLLFTESNNSIPLPFLGVLAFWLIIIFASFSLFANLNATVFVALSLFALSASGAIFLILELGEPFTGLLMISSEAVRNALAPLGP